MSDWEDFCGSMGWANDEHATDKLIDHIDRGNERELEDELREDGYKTIKEWNAIGRNVKMGENGRYLPCGKIRVFSESQTIESKSSNQPVAYPINKQNFQTFEDAIRWAKNNPGKTIMRSPKNNGYIEK